MAASSVVKKSRLYATISSDSKFVVLLINSGIHGFVCLIQGYSQIQYAAAELFQ